MHSAKVISAIFTSSTFLVHSWSNSSTNFFLHLQFLWSKYLPTSHDLSHSHSQLLQFQTDPLSHTPLSINYLHSHLNLSSLSTLFIITNPLHLIYIYTCTFHAILCVSFYFMCFSFLQHQKHTLYMDHRYCYNYAAFVCFNTKKIKCRPITININNIWSYLTFLIRHWNIFHTVAFS